VPLSLLWCLHQQQALVPLPLPLLLLWCLHQQQASGDNNKKEGQTAPLLRFRQINNKRTTGATTTTIPRHARTTTIPRRAAPAVNNQPNEEWGGATTR